MLGRSVLSHQPAHKGQSSLQPLPAGQVYQSRAPSPIMSTSGVWLKLSSVSQSGAALPLDTQHPPARITGSTQAAEPGSKMPCSAPDAWVAPGLEALAAVDMEESSHGQEDYREVRMPEWLSLDPSRSHPIVSRSTAMPRPLATLREAGEGPFTRLESHTGMELGMLVPAFVRKRVSWNDGGMGKCAASQSLALLDIEQDATCPLHGGTDADGLTPRQDAYLPDPCLPSALYLSRQPSTSLTKTGDCPSLMGMTRSSSNASPVVRMVSSCARTPNSEASRVSAGRLASEAASHPSSNVPLRQNARHAAVQGDVQLQAGQMQAQAGKDSVIEAMQVGQLQTKAASRKLEQAKSAHKKPGHVGKQQAIAEALETLAGQEELKSADLDSPGMLAKSEGGKESDTMTKKSWFSFLKFWGQSKEDEEPHYPPVPWLTTPSAVSYQLSERMGMLYEEMAGNSRGR